MRGHYEKDDLHPFRVIALGTDTPGKFAWAVLLPDESVSNMKFERASGAAQHALYLKKIWEECNED